MPQTMNVKFIVMLISVIIFSSSFVSLAYGSIYLDKETYTWTDKVNIRITEHGLDADATSVRIYTSDHELDNYKLSKAGNGLYTGEVILTGFLHDVNGDGTPDTNPRTAGSGPNNGFLETKRDGGFTVSVEFGDGDVISKSAKISWNKGNIVFDMPEYTPNESAKLQVTDVDMNLNPETLDTVQLHVFSDSDKAGILVDAIETQEESGVFETTVSFIQDSSSSGNRLFIVYGDTVYAQYDDHTLPAPYGINDDLEIITESTVNIDSPLKPAPEMFRENKESTLDISAFEDAPNDSYPSLSPLKQFHAGISDDSIQCKKNLVKILRHDNSPVCVMYQTAVKLTDKSKRTGWSVSEQLWSALSQKMNKFFSEQGCPRSCVFYDNTMLVSSINETLWYKPGLPKFLPYGYDFVQIISKENYVVVQISTNPITENFSWNDFYWQDHGIFLQYIGSSVTLDGRAQTAYWAINNDAKEMSLQKSDGVVYLKEREILYDDRFGIIYPTFSEAQFSYDDNLSIIIVGYISGEDMYEIVNSFFGK